MRERDDEGNGFNQDLDFDVRKCAFKLYFRCLRLLLLNSVINV